MHCTDQQVLIFRCAKEWCWDFHNVLPAGMQQHAVTCPSTMPDLPPHTSICYAPFSCLCILQRLASLWHAQMGGARAVPIPYDAPPEEVRRLFAAINGVIIPGGGQDLSPHHPFYDTTALLLQLTMAANDHGDFFPVRQAPRVPQASSVSRSGAVMARLRFPCCSAAVETDASNVTDA